LYKKILKSVKDDNILLHTVINIILVCEGARPSFLLESSDYTKEQMSIVAEIINKLNEKISKPLLSISDEWKFPRYFIFLKDSYVDNEILKDNSKIINEEWIAKFLGFNCVGHDYSNFKKNRIVLEFFLNNKKPYSQLIVEVCEMEKIDINILKKSARDTNIKYNKILNPLGYKTFFTIKIDISVTERYEKLLSKDIEYIKKHREEYLNDLYNGYIANTDVFNTSTTYNKIKNISKKTSDHDLNKLEKIYKSAVIDENFDNFYQTKSTLEDIKNIALDIKNFDDFYWSQKNIDINKPKIDL